MANKKKNIYNPINQLEKWYAQKVINDVEHYQTKYKFDMGENNDSTWNNEADAFKHAYMQAQFALLGGKHFAKFIGDRHENQGNQKGQPSGENNMDLWNNQQGRNIAKEIIYEQGAMKYPYSKKTRDSIAEKVMQKMKSGELITNPNDKRKYDYINKGYLTGHASSIKPDGQVYTPESIENMTIEEFTKNESAIMEQLRNGQIKTNLPKIDYKGYDKVFTREDIDQMSTSEYTKHEKEIMAQMNAIGIPSKNELPKGSKTYGKEKRYSTNQKDGKWVTINGNHVFIEE